MELVLRCENNVQVDALIVVDFTMIYVVAQAPVVIIVSRFILGY